MPDDLKDLERRFSDLKGAPKAETSLTDDDIERKFHSLTGRLPFTATVSMQQSSVAFGKARPPVSLGLADDLSQIQEDFRRGMTASYNYADSLMDSDDAADELMRQICAELALDKHSEGLSKLRDLEQRTRLDKLKDETKDIVARAVSTQPQPPQQATPPVSKQALFKNKKTPGTKFSCTVCNERADVACPSCDNDKYCQSCWNECHERTNPEMSTHKSKQL